MSITPIRSFDFTGLHSNIAWGLGFYIIGKGIDYLLKQHPFQFNRKTIWKNYQWSKIFCNLIVFGFLAFLSGFLEKIHISRFDKILSSSILIIWIKSLVIFCIIEPKIGIKIHKVISRYMDQLQINGITGVGKSPDLSDIL